MKIRERFKPGSRAESRKHWEMVRSVIRESRKQERLIRDMRKMGCSNYEIAKALDIPEDDIALL